ncbi:MAG: hypothetical protein RTU92_01060 [Candidatus Thorarchaeota archaeon]
MSKFICKKCGLDCATWLALSKHEKKGCNSLPDIVERAFDPPEYDAGGMKLHYFYSRFERLNEKCPNCKEIFADFWKKSDTDWVCLKCHTVFVPKSVMGKVLEYRKKQVEEEKSSREAARAAQND